MSKLPYFKFFVRDWLAGRIRDHSLEIQGIFANLIVLIWDAGGSVEYDAEKIARRLHGDPDAVKCGLDALSKDNLIQIHEDNLITIKFVSEQINEFRKLSNIRSIAGKESGKARSKRTKAKQVFNKCSTNDEQTANKTELYSDADAEADAKVDIELDISSERSKDHSRTGNDKEKISFNWDSEAFENISQSQNDIWVKTYPAVNIPAETLKAAAWQAANPKKRKKDYKKFLNSWFARQQERGGSKNYEQQEETGERYYGI
jgi:uncharacterized protein YdaU (DUF1376 family)